MCLSSSTLLPPQYAESLLPVRAASPAVAICNSIPTQADLRDVLLTLVEPAKTLPELDWKSMHLSVRSRTCLAPAATPSWLTSGACRLRADAVCRASHLPLTHAASLLQRSNILEHVMIRPRVSDESGSGVVGAAPSVSGGERLGGVVEDSAQSSSASACAALPHAARVAFTMDDPHSTGAAGASPLSVLVVEDNLLNQKVALGARARAFSRSGSSPGSLVLLRAVCDFAVGCFSRVPRLLFPPYKPALTPLSAVPPTPFSQLC